MKRLLLAIIFLISTTSLSAQTLDDLTLITEVYPPFNFCVDGIAQGISTDILVEILKLSGARQDRHLRLKSIAEINQKKLRVGVVLNDVGELCLKELGVKRRQIYRFNKGVQLAAMLQLGRIDLLAYDKLVTRWNLKSLGYAPNDYEAVYTLKQAEYYYAISRKTDDRIVARLQTALDQLRETGTLDQIIKNYLD